MASAVDVLMPTYNRETALSVTLASLIGQTFRDFRLIISDQTEDRDLGDCKELQAVLRVLRVRGHRAELHKHLPRRGLAEHRQFLLDQATAPYALFLDDDLILEPEVVARMFQTMSQHKIGFVGCAVIGLSFLHDVRPHEQEIEFWEEAVLPEKITPGSRQWQRYRLHNAANLYHLQQRLGITGDAARRYRIAWVGGCVLYDTQALRSCGGFHFWQALPPEHVGEDVLAQMRVMARYGGCGLLPSGVYHQELPTTLTNREVDAPKVMGTNPDWLLQELS